jgi:hypothetical protein
MEIAMRMEIGRDIKNCTEESQMGIPVPIY